MANSTYSQSPLRSLGIPLLLCCIGVAVALFILHQKDRRERDAHQARTDFRHIPPEWIAYQQTAIFAIPVEGQAISFAVMHDSTLVIGTANPHTLSFFDINGTPLRQIDLPEEPRAIAIGTEKTIFTDKIVVAHPQHLSIYDIEGEHELSFPIPRGIITIPAEEFVSRQLRWHPDAAESMRGRESNIRNLVLTPDYLFIADSLERLIYRFDADGRRDISFAPNDGFVVFVSPIVMTYSSCNDLLYIANPGRHRVDVFTQDGIYMPELSWGAHSHELAGFIGCCNPIGLAVLDDGRIVTVEKAASRIKIYRDGELDSIVAGWDTLENFPREFGRLPMQPSGRDFAAIPLSEGRIAVFDFDYKAVRIFAPKAEGSLLQNLYYTTNGVKLVVFVHRAAIFRLRDSIRNLKIAALFRHFKKSILFPFTVY